MENKLKVCFIGLKCYDQILGLQIPRYLGGIETQLVALAKGLTQQNCEVSFITYNHGQCEMEYHYGLKVCKCFAPGGGIKYVRSIYPQTWKLWKAMRKMDAAVYIQMGAGIETAQVGIGSRVATKRKSKFVYFFASDTDYQQYVGPHTKTLEGKLFLQGIRRASILIAQSERQRRGILEVFSLHSHIIPMALDWPCRVNVAKETNTILWVGRIVKEKRPDLFVNLAKRIPKANFHMIGEANVTSDYSKDIVSQAREVSNLHLHGRIERQKLSEFYSKATLLCCTSDVEGFPTTFLESWGHGLPVITTFDPDEIISRNKLGFVADNFDSLTYTINSILKNTSSLDKIVSNVVQFYEQNCSTSAVSYQFAELLKSIIR